MFFTNSAAGIGAKVPGHCVFTAQVKLHDSDSVATAKKSDRVFILLWFTFVRQSEKKLSCPTRGGEREALN
jgi:hypothetical protein